MPATILPADTSDGWFEEGQKLIVRGLVVENDLTTPASDVIVYYYHTDQKGVYATNETTRGSRKHGRLRGWVKTDQDGRFRIHTSRPAQYPSNNTEAHIHVIVKEPDLREPYWIDSWIFDDDPLLTPALRNRLENRGGSGILEIKLEGDIQVADQKIILGQNVPGYPK